MNDLPWRTGAKCIFMLSLVLLGSGCLTGKKGGAPLIDFGNSMVNFSSSMAFFEDSGDLTKDKTEYRLSRLTRDQFVLQELSASDPDSKMQVKFRLIENNFYIAQATMEGESFYVLLNLFDGGVRSYFGYDSVDDRELRALARLAESQKSGSNIDTERELFEFFSYVVNNLHQPYLEAQTFLSFNMENDGDVKLLAKHKALVAEAKKKAQ